MVRCLGVLLILALLLCGCAGESPEPTAPPEGPIGPAVSVPNLYVPQSEMELATNGAVRSFKPKNTGYYGCIATEKGLLLIGQFDGVGELALYTGEKLEVSQSISLGADVILGEGQIQVTDQGIGYFDKANKAMVFLNMDLMESGRMTLPEDVLSDVWLSPDWKTVYYCSDKGICVMDMQTGIARVLKEQSAFRQEITGGFGNGEALRYELERTEGETVVQLIDTTSGLVLQEGEYLNSLCTQSDRYFIAKSERNVMQFRYGKNDVHYFLWPEETSAQPQMLFENNAVVMVETTEDQTALVYYDLNTGKRLNRVNLPGITEIWGLSGDGKTGVWLFGKDTDGDELLYHWDATVNAETDETVYTEPRYTQEFVDSEGLSQLKQDAAALGEKFSVDILIYDDAIAAAPVDYVFTPEYMTQIYDYCLPQLDELLSAFPQEILTQGIKSKIQFLLVQKITGDPVKGGLAQTGALQFWNGDIPVIALVLDENLEQSFYHGVYHYMETRLLSKSSAIYEWHKYNPAGFTYDNSYLTNLDRTDMTYVEGEKQYFIDLFSMSYAREDRARIFEYACMPGNEELFQVPGIQTKLQRICKAIREAYGLKNVETVFPWEQYLK